jgi:hypothetical protein
MFGGILSILKIKKSSTPIVDRIFFYEEAKRLKLFNVLSQNQVDSIETILDTWNESEYNNLKWLAYMFGTVKHETGDTFRPIREWGQGKSRPYGKNYKHSGKAYLIPNQIYYGRGYVQLTWYENYELMGRLLKIDLLNNPELALDNKIAAKIMFEGMTRGASSFGDFTGRCLEQYITDTETDYIGARKIINGRDKAELIAEYAIKFELCLRYLI